MRLRPPIRLFFFNDTATTEIYTLSLHDALPISMNSSSRSCGWCYRATAVSFSSATDAPAGTAKRSEEHTSELQSHLNLVCRLLLEKKKTTRWTASARGRTAAFEQATTTKAGAPT